MTVRWCWGRVKLWRKGEAKVNIHCFNNSRPQWCSLAGETAGVAAAKEVCLVCHEGVIVFSCYLRNKTPCTGYQHPLRPADCSCTPGQTQHGGIMRYDQFLKNTATILSLDSVSSQTLPMQLWSWNNVDILQKMHFKPSLISVSYWMSLNVKGPAQGLMCGVHQISASITWVDILPVSVPERPAN